MPTAQSLVLIDKTYFILNINVSFRDGVGRLKITGALGDEIHNALHASIGAINGLDSFIDNYEPGIAFERDLHVAFHIVNCDEIPIAGTSYGLGLSMAILAAATHNKIPQEIVFTGCVGPAGEVLPVEDIIRKRDAARRLGFDKIMLPGSQLDMMSNVITQCPVHTIREAFSVTFWGD